MKKYKFLREGLKSNSGNCTWKVGEWKHEDNINICNYGFHCSDTPLQAFGYVQGEILAIVDVKGKSDKTEDKSVWSDMKIVKAYKWFKEDSVALSIYAAELVIDIFEKKYPNDNRPREAINAAKKWLKEPSQENASAASYASSASYAASSAASYASSASYAASYASSASYAASSAASAASAASSASSASSYASAASAASYASYADSAASYASYAASSAKKLRAELDKWLVKRIKKLEKYDK